MSWFPVGSTPGILFLLVKCVYLVKCHLVIRNLNIGEADVSCEAHTDAQRL